MSTKTNRRPRHDADADPWWSDPQPTLADVDVPQAAPRRRRQVQTRTSPGWTILRLLVAPLRIVAGHASRSPRVRRLALRLAVVLVVVTFLACSVGVILINNVVIGRTAELGELDDRRRELRRENALLGAESAQLSAPPVVVRRAERDLGMVRAHDLPQFIYLVPASRALTDFQRMRVASRAERLRLRAAAAAEERAARIEAAETSTTPPTAAGATATSPASAGATRTAEQSP